MPKKIPFQTFDALKVVVDRSKDLDKFLLHGGIPLGNLVLIEENGSTDFSSSLIKMFLSQGIVQNRIENFKNEFFTHNIVVGLDRSTTLYKRFL